jgi:hypothetical protein
MQQTAGKNTILVHTTQLGGGIVDPEMKLVKA